MYQKLVFIGLIIFKNIVLHLASFLLIIKYPFYAFNICFQQVSYKGNFSFNNDSHRDVGEPIDRVLYGGSFILTIF